MVLNKSITACKEPSKNHIFCRVYVLHTFKIFSNLHVSSGYIFDQVSWILVIKGEVLSKMYIIIYPHVIPNLYVGLFVCFFSEKLEILKNLGAALFH